MARYDRQYDYGLRGYDHGFRPLPPAGLGGYDTSRGRWEGAGPRYDAGFRARGGYDAGFRARPRYDTGYRVRGGAMDDRGYDFGMRGGEWLPHRVTQRYNLDYVNPPLRAERPLNYVPYGGDVEGRVGDMREYAWPYMTRGGTRTSRGGGRTVGWEHPYNRGRGSDGWGGPGW
ncbi:MAG: hypothetical protein JWM27_2823 [Gemmatimonadetes bacterium]|nr:hypothetical protein [Gemmatimonadota bacterium]